MIKVMIVDDEILARIGIKSIIPWIKHGFDVVAEAENGEKALALAKELQPDIVITDIKMPLLDGIELIKVMKALNMPTKFIVLSSYGDFDYVREAMKLGAEDYILKLKMEPDELLQMLIKIKDKIVKEKGENRSDMEHYLSSMREALFKRLLFGYFVDHMEIKREFQLTNIELPEKCIYCMLIKVDHYEVFKKYKEQNDLYVITYAMTNVIQEIVNELPFGYVFSTRPLEIVVIYAAAAGCTERSRSQKQMKELSERIQVALKQYLNISVMIGISEEQPSYIEIKKGYGQAVKAIQKGFSLPRASIIFYSQHIETQNTSEIELQEAYSKLEEACSIGAADRIAQGLRNIQQGLVGLSSDSLKGLCSSILFMLMSFFKSKDIPLVELWENDPFQQIERFQILQDYLDWLTMLIQTIEQQTTFGEYSRLVAQAKKYMIDHYQENISLQMVADQLHISSNYLSYLFKRETNENFIDHLIQIRIKHAKTLLTTTYSKVYEVGKNVGYHDSFYFSKIFKKVVGVTPQQYRASNNK